MSNNNLPLVSICIPTYNGADYLSESIQSVFEQSYKNLEIIISDDNSQDDTLKIAREYQKKSPVKFTIFEHERYGIAGNWNFSIEKSTGKYIKFIFQDDLLFPRCVEEMVKIAEKDDDIGLVFSPREVFLAEGAETDHGCIQVHEHGQDVHLYWSNLKPIQQGTELLTDPKFFESPLNKIGEPSAVLIRKSVFDEIGLFDEELHQTLDMDMWFRIICNYKIVFWNERLVRFRVHPKQASHKNLGLKNALDNQLLRAKMLYSPQYKISDPEVEKIFRDGTREIMKSELQKLFSFLEQLEQKAKASTQAEQEKEFKQLKRQLRKQEQLLAIKLNLSNPSQKELEESHQLEYEIFVKNAWDAYQNDDIDKSVSLLKKSANINLQLLPTELISDWFQKFSDWSKGKDGKTNFDAYSLINHESWISFLNGYIPYYP